MKLVCLVAVLLGIGYSNGAIFNPMMNPMMMAGMVKGGGSSSDMMKMMALMSMMNTPSNTNPSTTGATDATATAGATGAATQNPFMSSMIKMGLCQRTETSGDTPFCTHGTCMMQGMLLYGNPNMYQCVPGFGCCYKDHKSMMMSKLVN